MVGTSTVLVLVGAKLAWHGVWVCSGGCRPLVGTAGSPSTHGVALPFLLQWLSAGGRVHASNDLDGLQNGVGVIQATSAAVMEDIEWYVNLLTLDEYSPHALVRSVAGAGDREHWSFAVELTYRCLSSGLWRLSYGLPPELGLSSIDRRSEHQQSDQHHGAWSTCLDPGFVIRQVLPDGFGGFSVSTRGWGTGSRPMFNSNWWAKCGVPIRAILVAKLASCGGLGVLFPQGRNA